tara:strand:+ start:458 stop:1228 length:771 start_codon:yes stop_codon:yes gene_type:complete
MVDILQPPPFPVADWAFFLDFDGTLVDIAPRPEAIQVADGLTRLLENIRRIAGGAVAVVTGRTLADLDTYLHLPDLAASGVHGLERRGSTGVDPREREKARGAMAAVRECASGLLARYPSLQVEDKGEAIAVHFRSDPERGGEVQQALARAAEGGNGALSVLSGKMVVEVKPSAATKGAAVEAFLAQPVFAGRRPCFIGDDVTDEDGFRVCKARGGITIHVGPDTAKTLADYRLSSPEAVHRWLEQLVSTDLGAVE